MLNKKNQSYVVFVSELKCVEETKQTNIWTILC